MRAEGGLESIDHLFQGAQFIEKLRTLGEQNTTKKAIHARDALLADAAEIRGVERNGIGSGAVAAGVLAHLMEDGDEGDAQTLAEGWSDAGSLPGFPEAAALHEFHGFIQSHTEHDVRRFEVGLAGLKRLVLSARQPAPPIVGNRQATARRGGVHGWCSESRKYTGRAARDGTGLLRVAGKGRYTRGLL